MINKIKYLLFLFCCVFFTFCTQNKIEKKNTEGISPAIESYKKFNNRQMVQELKEKVLLGDTISFKELESIYWDSGHSQEFLYFAQMMAENYDYNRAYYSVYQIIKPDTINDKNVRINKFANYYLLKANEKGYKYAKSSIKVTFGDSTEIPNSRNYWKEIDK